MPTQITLPKLSDTMEEGKVLRWLKRVGDQIAPGDVVAEVETDKADMEIEAADGGVLREIKVQEGETAEVGAVLAVLGDQEGVEERRPGVDGREPAAEEKGRASAGREPKVQDREPEHPEPEEPEAEEPEPVEKSKRSSSPRPAAAPSAPAVEPARLRASPLAQRLARERGVDLKQVRGSGAEGKVVARDVEAPAASGAPAERRAPGAERPATSDERPTSRDQRAATGDQRRAPSDERPPSGRQALSKMRQTIARRMTEAKSGVPHFYVVAEIEMDEAARLLEALKQQVEEKITVSHLVIKAAAMALQEHPRVNGLWADGAVEIPASVNIGLAVAVEDGLLLPVIHGCERLSLAEVAAEARRLVSAAREGGFSGDDLKGGTFSISNLGMLDVDEFSAIINPPQAAILAVGSIKQRPVVRDGQLAVGRTMRVTLSCDHRQLNGVEGARFLETLKAILENPLRLVLAPR